MLGILCALVLVVLVGGLVLGHLAVRREGDPLPPAAAVTALGPGPDRVGWIETARQPMPRSAVLDGTDPDPAAPYVMAHPAFVLGWPDGRLLLVDVGMTPEAAATFGKPLELAGGASPMEPLTSAAAALGPDRARVAGVVFTHLHTDHVGGLPALCDDGPASIPVFLGASQAEHPNWTTRPGLRIVRGAPCASEQRIDGPGPLRALPGFPGVGVFHAGGHTPGSQVVFANVGGRRIAFVGDLVNNVDGIRHDVPKPFLYSLLIVPEARDRLHDLRVWLRDLGATADVTLVPAHDEGAIRAAGLPTWTPAGS